MLKLKHEDFYNSEIKFEYLESFEEEKTAYITSFIFKKSKEIEEALRKDIYDMSKNELAEVMKALSVSSEDSAYIKAVQLEQYIDWAVEAGHVGSNLNPLSNINKREWSSQFVATYKQAAFTREKIIDMCDDLYNWGDKAVLLAIFEGISGEGYSEILNLQKKDLKEKNNKFYADLVNKEGKERTIEISEELYTYLSKTDDETEYTNKNGQVEGERWSKSQLLDSPYIFKKTTRGKQEGKLDLFYVNRKFQIYKEVFNLKFLRSKHIENSGIMHMANELHKRDGEFKQEHLLQIAEQYDTTFTKVGEREERVTSVIKLLLQSDLFENLYGYKII